MKSLLVLPFVAAFLFGSAFGDLIPFLNCSAITDSPQFAQVCRVPEGVDAILPNLSLEGVTNLTANMICDRDCRCIHGAKVRGGRCGTPAGKTEKYCVCDYATSPTRETLWPNSLCLPDVPITNLCKVDLISNTILDGACERDCFCSHGAPSGNNHCSKDTVGSDGVSYCMCNGGWNW